MQDKSTAEIPGSLTMTHDAATFFDAQNRSGAGKLYWLNASASRLRRCRLLAGRKPGG
jgi:hypothetical protein